MTEEREDLFVAVETHAGYKFVSKVVIDYHVQANRKWLARHCRWAYHNGFTITTYRTRVQPTFDVRETNTYKQRRNEQ